MRASSGSPSTADPAGDDAVPSSIRDRGAPSESMRDGLTPPFDSSEEGFPLFI